MTNFPEDYIRYVLDDVEYYKDKRVIKKAGVLERYLKKYASPKKLHPNPKDEFSMDSVGPNFGIVSDYSSLIRNRLAPLNMEIFKEPVIVEKMEPDGYMLLNGHHRWYAAMRNNVNKLHIRIVNLVSENDIDRMLDGNTNKKRVSFDLDEVLLASETGMQAQVRDSLFSRMIKVRLRSGAPDVIKAFKNAGYDIWVYTAGYESEEYITDLFSMYDITVDGILNGFNEKRRADAGARKRIMEKMSLKYESAVHVDNSSVLRIDPEEKSFEQFDIGDESENWSQGVISIIKKL